MIAKDPSGLAPVLGVKSCDTSDKCTKNMCTESGHRERHHSVLRSLSVTIHIGERERWEPGAGAS